MSTWTGSLQAWARSKSRGEREGSIMAAEAVKDPDPSCILSLTLNMQEPFLVVTLNDEVDHAYSCHK